MRKIKITEGQMRYICETEGLGFNYLDQTSQGSEMPVNTDGVETTMPSHITTDREAKILKNGNRPYGAFRRSMCENELDTKNEYIPKKSAGKMIMANNGSHDKMMNNMLSDDRNTSYHTEYMRMKRSEKDNPRLAKEIGKDLKKRRNTNRASKETPISKLQSANISPTSNSGDKFHKDGQQLANGTIHYYN